MITLLSATPGSGKSLLATDTLLDISRDNVANLKHNFYYAKAFFEKLEQLKKLDYLDQILVTRGQGLERTIEIVFLTPDFFDFLKTEYFINVISNPQTDDIVVNFPPHYFERISLLNLIIDNLNVNENTKFKHFKPVRAIYTNIADLKLIQCRPLPPDCDWRSTPQGSYFAIDEAQLINIFSDEAKGIDPIVKDLTIHRHKGYDFLFITQEPSFVHKYIRKLASHHIHLVNIFGWEQSMKLEWSVVQDSPNAIKAIARTENFTRWRFPKHVYKLYKSSTIHTKKKRLPKKLVLLSFAALFVFALALFLLFSPDQKNPLVAMAAGNPLTHSQEKKNEQPTQPTSGAIPTTEQKNPQNVQNQNEAAASSPVVDSASVTVPAYDITDPYAYQPVVNPNPVNHRVFSGCFCQKNTCKAYDQQGTSIDGISPKVCKELLKDSSNRPFNYFEKPQQANANTSTTGSLATQQTSTDISISMSKEDLAKYEQAKKEGLI